VGANEPAALLAKLTERSVLLQMIRQVVAPAIKPKARSYFGIDAEAYGHASHIDMSALKVPSAHKIYTCARELNNFNNGWDVSAPSGC